MKLYTIFLFLLPLIAKAQKKVNLRAVTAKSIVEYDTTPHQAEINALQEAKLECLRKAGVQENVWSIMGQQVEENNSEFFEAYSEISAITINGLVAIKNKEIHKTWDPIKEHQVIEVKVDAEVTKDERTADPEFLLEVNGITSNYKQGEKLNFEATVFNKKSYVQVFWFDGNEGSVLFPSNKANSDFTEPDKVLKFPPNEGTSYKLFKNDTTKDREEVHLIVIATKDRIPYLGNVDFESLFSWFSKIPINRRVLYHKSFYIS